MSTCRSIWTRRRGSTSWRESDPRLPGMVAALPLEHGKAIEAELDQLRQHKILRGIRRLIQNQPDPGFLHPARTSSTA